jgi:hypothetical protein
MSLHSLALISSSPIGEGPNFRLDIDAQSAAQPERLGRGVLAAHMPNRSNDFRTLVFLARASCAGRTEPHILARRVCWG